MKFIRKNSPELVIIKKLLKEHGIKYRFYWGKCGWGISGLAMSRKNLILCYTIKAFIKKNQLIFKPYPINEFLSTVFHEMQHVLLYRKGLHSLVHGGIYASQGYEVFKQWSKDLLKAERMADKHGKAMMAKHFPKMKYISGYDGRSGSSMVKRMIVEVKKEWFPSR